MKQLLLISMSVLLTLLLAEVGLRVLGRFRPPDPPSAERPDLYVADETLGYRLWPSTRTCTRYPASRGQVQELVSNAQGFRSSRDFDAEDPRPRIAVVGDSFVQGLGVEEGDRLTEVVERLEPGWRVEPWGMAGWSVGLMVRAVEAMAPRHQPAMVALAVYTDDLRRANPYYAGVGFPIPRFALVDGVLVTRPFPESRGWKRSRLVQAFIQAGHRRDPDFFELNRALLDHFQSLSQLHGFQPALLFLPGRGASPRDYRRRDFVQAWSQAAGVPFLDLSEPIHAAGAEATYIPGNPHWNEAGHRIAGEQLRLFLQAVAPPPLVGASGNEAPRSGGRVDACHDGVNER